MADGDAKAIADSLLAENTSYCEELGIDLKTGGPEAVFQWLCCSIIFGNRLSERVRSITIPKSATHTFPAGVWRDLYLPSYGIWQCSHRAAGMRALCVV